jgi:predicted ester cyclase
LKARDFFFGISGNRRRASFRMLHVWGFKDGRMSRENVWLDGNAIVPQLGAPDEHTALVAAAHE